MHAARASGGHLKYAEGLCLTPFGALLHAWNVRGGTVVDYTWPAEHLYRYFGIIFDLEWLDKEMGMPRGGVFCRWDPVYDYLQNRH